MPGDRERTPRRTVAGREKGVELDETKSSYAIRVLSTCLLLIVGTSGASAAPGTWQALSPGSQLVVGPDLGDGSRDVAFDRSPAVAPVMIGRASAEVVSGSVIASGIDSILWATWQERTLVSMLSISKDDGNSWSRPRPLVREIRLLAGNFIPGSSQLETQAALTARAESSLRLVQFHTQSLSAWRARLSELGAEVLSPIPFNAHIVRMSDAVATAVARERFVRWIGPYHPGYRLAPALKTELLNTTGDDVRRRFVLQTLIDGAAEKTRLASAVETLGGSVVKLNPQGYQIEAMLTASEALKLTHSDHLLWLQLWTPPEDDMDIVRIVSGANYVDTVAGYDGTGVRGEVLDGGTDLDHQDFDGILTHGIVNNGNHGTCTYGIVFSNGDRDRPRDGDPTALGHLPAAQGYAADYSEVVDRYAHTAELVTAPIEAVFQTNSWGNARTTLYETASAEMDDILWLNDIAIYQSQSNAGNRGSRPQAWAKKHHLNWWRTPL